MVASISKTPVGRELAAAIVRSAFGADVALAAIDECTEGWFNAVYRLVLDNGTSCILKIAPPADVRVMRYEHDIIATEVDALRLVRERTGVPVPEVIAWDPTGTIAPSPYFLMSECPGVLLSDHRAVLDPDAQDRIDRDLLSCVASVNAIRGPAFGRFDRAAPRHPVWSAAFGELFGDLLADADDAGVALDLPTDDLRALVAEQAEWLDAVTSPRLVHWDLWDSNVFVDADSAALVGVIDFERALWADPLMEAQFVGRRSGDDPRLAAYGSAPFDAPFSVERRRLYDLYLGLVMTIESSYRNYPTADIEGLGRAMATAALDEIRAH